MNTPKVKIYFFNNVLNIEDSSNAIGLPSDRIFFANILGFNIAEDFSGYELKNNKEIVSILIEAIKYLKEKNIETETDSTVKNIVEKNKSNVSELSDAKRNGLLIKKNPPVSITTPDFFKRKLKSYQIPPVAHHVKIKNSADFSVPGSGKTTIALATYSILKNNGDIEKLIVIAPRAAFQPWEDEYYECYKKKPRSVRITGNKAYRKRLYNNLVKSDLILLTYQMASQDAQELLKILQKYKVLLILDESHNIKRIQGGKWATTILNLSSIATRRIILTGTPVPNSLEDLWTQMTFLWPNPPLLGTSQEYKAKVEESDSGTIDKIKQELFPFYYRITKNELKLKNPKFNTIKIAMRPYQQAIYDALAIKVLSELIKAPEERIKLKQWRRARLIRLLQVASNPALLTKDSLEFQIPPIDATGLSIDNLISKYSQLEFPPKIEAVVELTKKLLSRNKKVLIWSTFIHNIETLKHLLKKYKPRYIYGDVPKDSSENEEINREKMIHEFKTSSSHNLLIANPSACAESISLHKVCHHAIYLDRSFNGTHYMQSLDRIHRIGLDPNTQVNYYFFQAKNSVDEIIDTRLKEKQKRMLELLDDDFAILNLETSEEEFSEVSDEEEDFNSVINQLKAIYDR